MKVTRISVYPIKATCEVSLDEAEVHPRGLSGDRRWMVVNAAGNFLQQRVQPELGRVRATPQVDGSLWVDAPGMPQLCVVPPVGGDRQPVKVWDDSLSAALAGAEAAGWFSTFLGRECFLVYMDQACQRPVAAEYGREGDVVSFADAMPLLLTTEASLADLNRRMGKPIPMSRFRPNIIVGGSKAWEEDDWRRIRIGETEFEITHPCARCVVTTIDQQSGIKSADGEPLKTLATFRSESEGVTFGQNLVPRTTGIIRVGDAVTVC